MPQNLSTVKAVVLAAITLHTLTRRRCRHDHHGLADEDGLDQQVVSRCLEGRDVLDMIWAMSKVGTMQSKLGK